MPDDNSALERITFQPGETIFNEGDDGQSAYIIESGMVEIAREVGGKKVTLGTIDKNGIFGEMALIDESKRIADATALIETTCIHVPKIAIQKQLEIADPLLRKLVQVLLSNARSLSDHITRVIEDDNSSAG